MRMPDPHAQLPAGRRARRRTRPRLPALPLESPWDEAVSGPVGALPGHVRINRGKELLCDAVTATPGTVAVPVVDLPAWTPYLKGSVEALNDAAAKTYLVTLPRHWRSTRSSPRSSSACTGGTPPTSPPL